MTAPDRPAVTEEEIEKAAKIAAISNANEWYTPEEIKSDGGYRWSVHRDGAEDGFIIGYKAALAACASQSKRVAVEAKIEALEASAKLCESFNPCHEVFADHFHEEIARLRKEIE